MKAETKIMHQRLEALKLAEELGNVSRVHRERGISHTQFYEYRKRFKEQGFEGLRGTCLPSTKHTLKPHQSKWRSVFWNWLLKTRKKDAVTLNNIWSRCFRYT